MRPSEPSSASPRRFAGGFKDGHLAHLRAVDLSMHSGLVSILVRRTFRRSPQEFWRTTGAPGDAVGAVMRLHNRLLELR
jgi:hypothetical protein